MDQAAGRRATGGPRAARGARVPFGRIAAAAALFSVVICAGAFGYAAALSRARLTRAIDDIREIEQRALNFALTTGDLPPSLQVIGWRRDDPWGGAYEYRDLQVRHDSGADDAAEQGPAARRKDRRHRDLNTDFDLYSRGPDRATHPQLGSPEAEDDIVRAANGGFVGVAGQYEGR